MLSSGNKHCYTDRCNLVRYVNGILRRRWKWETHSEQEHISEVRGEDDDEIHKSCVNVMMCTIMLVGKLPSL